MHRFSVFLCCAAIVVSVRRRDRGRPVVNRDGDADRGLVHRVNPSFFWYAQDAHDMWQEGIALSDRPDARQMPPGVVRCTIPIVAQRGYQQTPEHDLYALPTFEQGLPKRCCGVTDGLAMHGEAGYCVKYMGFIPF